MKKLLTLLALALCASLAASAQCGPNGHIVTIPQPNGARMKACAPNMTWTGDMTKSSAVVLPELKANGSNDTRIYGADTQASSGCIIWPVGTSTSGQVAADSNDTKTTTDGKTCRVFKWQTPGGGGGIFQDWWIGAQMNGAFQAVGWNLSTAGTSVWQQDGRYVLTFTSTDSYPSAVHFAYLPSPYTTAMTMTLTVLINSPNGGTGNVKLIAKTYCAGGAGGAANAQTWHGTTSATVTAPSIGTLALVTLTPLDNTGCSADSSLGVQLQRDNTVVSNLADTVEIVQVGFYAQ